MVATQTCFIFTPDPWGFRIQFDDIIFFKWVENNHHRSLALEWPIIPLPQMALILDAMLVLRLYRGNNPWTLGVGCGKLSDRSWQGFRDFLVGSRFHETIVVVICWWYITSVHIFATYVCILWYLWSTNLSRNVIANLLLLCFLELFAASPGSLQATHCNPESSDERPEKTGPRWAVGDEILPSYVGIISKTSIRIHMAGVQNSWSKGLYKVGPIGIEKLILHLRYEAGPIGNDAVHKLGASIALAWR